MSLVPCIVCPGHTRPVLQIVFSKPNEDGTFLFSASKDSLPMARDGATGDWIGTFQGHKGAVWGVDCDVDATRVATASADYTAALWSAVDGSRIAELPHQTVVKSVALAPSCRALATGGKNKRLLLWQAPWTEPVADTQLPAEVTKLLWKQFGDTTLLIACDDKGGMHIWNVSEDSLHSSTLGEPLTQFMAAAPITDVVALDDRAVLVTAGKEIKALSMPDCKPLWQVATPTAAGSAHISADGKWLAAGCSDLWVHVGPAPAPGVGVDAPVPMDVQEQLRGHHGPVHCLRWNPTDAVITTASEDGTIRLWNWAKGLEAAKAEQGSGAAEAAAAAGAT